MMLFFGLAPLYRSDKDHFGSTPRKQLCGNLFIYLVGYKQTVLKGKEMRMQRYEVFDKGKPFRLADRQLYELNGWLHLLSYYFGIPW